MKVEPTNMFDDVLEKLESVEEDDECIEELIEIGYKFYKSTKRRIFTRGFIMGALSTVAIQSVITILVLIK